MTTEDAIREIKRAESQFDFEFQEAAQKRDCAIKTILNEWAVEHSRFTIGDFVVRDNSIVRIDKFEPVRNAETNHMYIRYFGTEYSLHDDYLMTDGSGTIFYEDKNLRLFNPLLRKRKQILVKIKN